MGAECWVCGGRGGSQVVLRPDGANDGRRVCRVCTRRLVSWLHGLADEGREATLARVWPALAREEEPAPAGPDEQSACAASLESIALALPGADDATKVSVAIGYLELGLLARGLEALFAADPASIEVATDRALASLLSRLLHPARLSPEAREVLEGALYPGPPRP